LVLHAESPICSIEWPSEYLFKSQIQCNALISNFRLYWFALQFYGFACSGKESRTVGSDALSKILD